ncbi:uncharacterized protein LOC110907186 [Helianthus annuus]|uniref:uncharacterized protein LOC110907186 n=1 Tax=Helianthus annuus TaxID=4232 RepID=UPI000B909EAB|nr:uncharacterized protein LOC110907186 [Helianthus annuus]
MGALKDLARSFSRMTQEEVDLFCLEYGIDKQFNPTAPACDASIDKPIPGFIALYCRHFEWSNLRYPFSFFVLNLLEYYRVSFGQVHPKGMARVLHFEVLCRALGYDPSLLLFRRFFRLAKNGDWFTFENTKVETCLVSSMVTTLGSWKNTFFWVSESIIPFKMVWRHPDAVLNDPEPSESELNDAFLSAIRGCPSRVRPFPEHLLVLLGVSNIWAKVDRDPVLMRNGLVMSALDFIKSDDTSDVVFEDAPTVPGENVVVRTSEQRFEGSGYVSVENVKGFTKSNVPKPSTRRLSRRLLKATPQSTSTEPVDLSDDIEVSEDQAEAEVEKEKELVVRGKKVRGKKGVATPVQESSSRDVEGLNPEGTYVPSWLVKNDDTFKDAAVCEDALSHLAPPSVQKEAAWKKEIEDLKKMHAIEMGDLKKSFEANLLKLKADREALSVQQKAFREEKEGLKASVGQVTADNQWLIEHGFQQGLKPEGLNEKVCAEVLGSLSRKRSYSGDSDDTLSSLPETSKDAGLETSAVGGEEGVKVKKTKKAKKSKGEGSKPSDN